MSYKQLWSRFAMQRQVELRNRFFFEPLVFIKVTPEMKSRIDEMLKEFKMQPVIFNRSLIVDVV